MSASTSVPVWDPLLRVLHWSLVAAVALAWLTTWRYTGWHEVIGYAGLAVVALRVLWGLAGPKRARFAAFVRGPGATSRYAVRLVHGDAPRHLGHNPLGAWMAIVLLACLPALALT